MKDRNYSRLDKLEEAARKREQHRREKQVDLSTLNTEERIKFRRLLVRLHEIEEEQGVDQNEAMGFLPKEEMKELYHLIQIIYGRDAGKQRTG